MHDGTRSRIPARHTVTGRQATSPVERMIQSSSTWRYFTTCGSPWIVTRSKRAPDLESAASMTRRSVAPASSSSTVEATARSGTDGAPVPVGDQLGLLHLGEQRGRPAAPAPHRVAGDTPVAQVQDVRLSTGVGHFCLDPDQVELDELPIGDRRAPEGLESARVGEPPRQLGPN